VTWDGAETLKLSDPDSFTQLDDDRRTTTGGRRQEDEDRRTTTGGRRQEDEDRRTTGGRQEDDKLQDKSVSEFDMTWREELRSRQFWRAVLAELLGTLVLVSAVLGASVPGPGEAPGGPLYPAVALGAVIVALGHCFGEISGAQVNPAVTLSLLATRRLDVLRAVLYIAVQCLGASLGAGALYLALPLKTTADHFVNKVPMELNAAQALGVELLCTFQMVFTIFSVEDQRRRESPEPGNLAIGLAHTAGVMIGFLFFSFL
ncbi:putative aquaporin-4-like, partial [Scophthalmus maximus]